MEKPFFACPDEKLLYFSRKNEFSIFSLIFHDFPVYQDLKILVKYEKIENFKKKFSETFFQVNSKNFYFWSFHDSQRIFFRNTEPNEMEPLRKNTLVGNCLPGPGLDFTGLRKTLQARPGPVQARAQWRACDFLDRPGQAPA